MEGVIKERAEQDCFKPLIVELEKLPHLVTKIQKPSTEEGVERLIIKNHNTGRQQEFIPAEIPLIEHVLHHSDETSRLIPMTDLERLLWI